MVEPKKTQVSFDAIPSRAKSDLRLTRTHWAVLSCVASRDRMSGPKGKGQGCLASNKTMAAEANLNYSNFSAALGDVIRWQYITKTKVAGTLRALRISYDALPTGKEVPLPMGKEEFADGQSTFADGQTDLCPTGNNSEGKQPLADQDYILSNSHTNTSIESGSAPRADCFDLFFEAFPKKEHEKAAEREYRAALGRGATDAELLDGARRYTAHIAATGKELQFVALAKNWLADDRWRDDYGKTGSNAPPIDTCALRASWGGEAGKLIDALGDTGPALFVSWFANARFEDGTPPRIRVPKEFHRAYIASKFARPLREAFGEIILEVAA